MKKQLRPSGPMPSRIMLVDECYRKADCEQGFPFSGFLGKKLGELLSSVGIRLDHCYSTWATRHYSPDGGESFFAQKKNQITDIHRPLYPDNQLTQNYCLPQVHENIQTLAEEINSCTPNVIIAFGNTALFALTGKWGIQKYRGSLLDCTLPGLVYAPKVIPVQPVGIIMWKEELKPIMQQDLRRVVKESQNKEHIRPDYKFIIRPNYGEALATLQFLLQHLDKGPCKIACDIETRSYHIACIQLSWSPLEAITIPLMCVEREEGYWTLEEETNLMWMLRKVLTHRNCLCVGQNFHYDAQYLHRYLLFVPSAIRDTMIAQHSMFSTMQKSLDFLSSMYCEYHVYWKDDGKEWTADMDEEQLWEYGARDAVITWEVDREQQKAVDQMGLRGVHDFQQSLFFPVLETMLSGARIDTKLRDSYALTLFDEIAKREQWLIDTLDYPLNIRSPKQMRECFLDDLGQKGITPRGKKGPSFDDERLREMQDREPLLAPLCRKISELRSLGVFLSTFVRAPLDIDKRMRCMFKVTGTETYRFASSKNAFGTGMNMQNIPKGGEDEELELPNIRALFIPDPGHEYFDIDLDSADLRIVCWESDCREMKAMINSGAKVYVEVAKEYYNDPTITKHHPSYRIFKSLCHGTNYLGTAKGLADRLGLLVHETEVIQKWYFGKFPEIKRWQENIKHQVLTRRMVENVFGYRLYIFQKLEGTIMNQVIAWIPQSTVGCLINRVYVNIYNNLKEVQVQLQVHDSLAGQYHISKADWCRKRIIEEAQIVLPYAGDPTIVPVGIKTSRVSWGECG